MDGGEKVRSAEVSSMHDAVLSLYVTGTRPDRHRMTFPGDNRPIRPVHTGL